MLAVPAVFINDGGTVYNSIADVVSVCCSFRISNKRGIDCCSGINGAHIKMGKRPL